MSRFRPIGASTSAYLLKVRAFFYYAITALLVGTASIVVSALKLSESSQGSWIGLIPLFAGAYSLSRGFEDLWRCMGEFPRPRLPRSLLLRKRRHGTAHSFSRVCPDAKGLGSGPR